MSEVFSHSGDIGDLIAALPTMKALGGGRLNLFPSRHTGHRMTPERAASLKPLLEIQPYVSSVQWSEGPVGTNLDKWRSHYKTNLNLADMVSECHGVPHYPRENPWLEVDRPDKVARVVMGRSPRYHNWNFVAVWKSAWEKYRLDAVFVGSPEEHADFCLQVGPLPYFKTDNHLQLARVIAGSELCLFNQTGNFWLAEGMKKQTVLEVCLKTQNCHFSRRGLTYGVNEHTQLPVLSEGIPLKPSLDLTVIVVSWKRPHLLKDTLASIKSRLEGLSHKIVVADNESSEETRKIIQEAGVECWPLAVNAGINWPVQHLLGPMLDSEFVCVSDHDIFYGRPFADYIAFLRANPDVSFAKGLDSPEHDSFGEREFRGENWLLKRTERGGGLIMRSETLKKAFPLPDHPINFDWHMCATNGVFAVLPGTVAHTGWRESTREGMREIPEKYLLIDGEIRPVNS
ncbi:glycosyltransferase family protein [Zavarzinella formosa]|uniref:hypothetical protein n=1 Tax=Zavarzinella formosa TaxID=360055 RepID=UPI0002FA8EF9|nr:hypothetical protein [Zavarzinella formosa]